MAYNTFGSRQSYGSAQQNTQQNTQPREELNANFEVRNVKINPGGTTFSLHLTGFGVTLFQMRVCRRKDGSGEFIGTPQFKGQDGKWRNSGYSCYMSAAMQAAVIAEVHKMEQGGDGNAQYR